ncbi:MAG: hypothetical protein IKY35_00735, partial [Muribaculaceae bacterium]|nr:hypothetical protein [Muribaculaceae bacterium]
MYNPYRGRYTYAPQSGGGTRYARLPPVIEIIPLSGYRSSSLATLRHTTPKRVAATLHEGLAWLPWGWVDCLLALLASDGGTRYARLPPVIEIIPLSGYVMPRTQHILLG